MIKVHGNLFVLSRLSFIFSAAIVSLFGFYEYEKDLCEHLLGYAIVKSAVLLFRSECDKKLVYYSNS